jgi:hypothetical protein
LPIGDIKKEIDIKNKLDNNTTLLSKPSSGDINTVNSMNEGSSSNSTNNGSGNNPEQIAEETSASGSASASVSRSNIPTDIPVVNTAPLYGVQVPKVPVPQVPAVSEYLEGDKSDSSSVCSSIHTNDSENTINKKVSKLFQEEEQKQLDEQEQINLKLALHLSSLEYQNKNIQDMQPQDVVDSTGRDKGKGKLIEDEEENSSVPISKTSEINPNSEVPVDNATVGTPSATEPKVQKKVTFSSDTKLGPSQDMPSNKEGRFIEDGKAVEFDVEEYNRKNIRKAIISNLNLDIDYTNNKELTSNNETETSSSEEDQNYSSLNSETDDNKNNKKK